MNLPSRSLAKYIPERDRVAFFVAYFSLSFHSTHKVMTGRSEGGGYLNHLGGKDGGFKKHESLFRLTPVMAKKLSLI